MLNWMFGLKKQRKLEEQKLEEQKANELNELIKINKVYPAFDFLTETMNNILETESSISDDGFTKFKKEQIEIKFYKHGRSKFDVEVRYSNKIVTDIESYDFEFQKFETNFMIDNKLKRLNVEQSQTIKELKQLFLDVAKGNYRENNIDQTINLLRKESMKNRLRNELSKESR